MHSATPVTETVPRLGAMSVEDADNLLRGNDRKPERETAVPVAAFGSAIES